MSSEPGRRVVVTGATGDVGTSVVRLLSEDPQVDSVLGLARRIPRCSPPGAEWAAVDLAVERPHPVKEFEGAAAVVHLAWASRPVRDPVVTWRTNVLGGIRVFEAVAAAGVPVLVHASSVGAYSPGPRGHAVDESWPTHGWPDAAYCREKAYLERVLDIFERDHPEVRVVRMRPAFLFKREPAGSRRRVFGGRFLPGPSARPDLLPFLPAVPGLRVQTLHPDDAAEAYRLAVSREVRGAFNLAAEPPVDAELLGEMFGARPVRLPRGAARSALAAAWGLRLLPASPPLFDAILRLPLLDCARAHTELGWHPRHTSTEILEDFLLGLRRDEDGDASGDEPETAESAPSRGRTLN